MDHLNGAELVNGPSYYLRWNPVLVGCPDLTSFASLLELPSDFSRTSRR